MDIDNAIRILESGSKMPDFPHTTEELDEACKMACAALRAMTTLNGTYISTSYHKQELEWKDKAIELAQRKQAEAEAERDKALGAIKEWEKFAPYLAAHGMLPIVKEQQDGKQEADQQAH